MTLQGWRCLLAMTSVIFVALILNLQGVAAVRVGDHAVELEETEALTFRDAEAERQQEEAAGVQAAAKRGKKEMLKHEVEDAVKDEEGKIMALLGSQSAAKREKAIFKDGPKDGEGKDGPTGGKEDDEGKGKGKDEGNDDKGGKEDDKGDEKEGEKGPDKAQDAEDPVDQSPSPPSGDECPKQDWGRDGELGNRDMKAWLAKCTDGLEMKSPKELKKELEDKGCRYEFDVTTWADFDGVQDKARDPQTGGIYCARVFTVKPQLPPECLEGKRGLYAATSGGAGPKPISIPSIKSGKGLNKLQNNYTYWTSLHPKDWVTRKVFRDESGICSTQNHMDTVIEVVLKQEAAKESMRIIVGPGDSNEECEVKQMRTRRLKALLCIHPLEKFTKAVNMQEIDWKPKGDSDPTIKAYKDAKYVDDFDPAKPKMAKVMTLESETTVESTVVLKTAQHNINACRHANLQPK